MDSPNVRIAKRFVDWWQNTHGNHASFSGPEYTLAKDAFIAGFISPLMNSGEQLSPDITKSLHKSLAKQIEEVVNTPKDKT